MFGMNEQRQPTDGRVIIDDPREHTPKCVAFDCHQDAVPNAPVDLCLTHTRETWQYAQSMIDSANLVTIADQVADEIDVDDLQAQQGSRQRQPGRLRLLHREGRPDQDRIQPQPEAAVPHPTTESSAEDHPWVYGRRAAVSRLVPLNTGTR